MSTRKDGLLISAVGRTVTYLAVTHGCRIIGGNKRVLHIARKDGEPDVAGARGRHGTELGKVLCAHGLTLRSRRGVNVVDLLECSSDATAETHRRLCERAARADECEERADAIAAGLEPVDADQSAGRVGDDTYRFCMQQTQRFVEGRLGDARRAS